MDAALMPRFNPISLVDPHALLMRRIFVRSVIDYGRSPILPAFRTFSGPAVVRSLGLTRSCLEIAVENQAGFVSVFPRSIKLTTQEQAQFKRHVESR